MEKDQQELYEYARKRLSQKKQLYFHFVLLIVGGIALCIANHFSVFGFTHNWSAWVLAVWTFIFIFHFIKVFITDRFMNKLWEKEQIERLVSLQQQKIIEFKLHIEEDTLKKTE